MDKLPSFSDSYLSCMYTSIQFILVGFCKKTVCSNTTSLLLAFNCLIIKVDVWKKKMFKLSIDYALIRFGICI